MKLYRIGSFFEGETVYLTVSPHDKFPHTINVDLVTTHHKPYARLTANTDYNFEIDKKFFYCSFLNVNAPFDVKDFVESNKIAKPFLDTDGNVITHQSGDTSYSLYDFNPYILGESDIKGLREYERVFIDKFIGSKTVPRKRSKDYYEEVIPYYPYDPFISYYPYDPYYNNYSPTTSSLDSAGNTYIIDNSGLSLTDFCIMSLLF